MSQEEMMLVSPRVSHDPNRFYLRYEILQKVASSAHVRVQKNQTGITTTAPELDSIC